MAISFNIFVKEVKNDVGWCWMKFVLQTNFSSNIFWHSTSKKLYNACWICI